MLFVIKFSCCCLSVLCVSFLSFGMSLIPGSLYSRLLFKICHVVNWQNTYILFGGNFILSCFFFLSFLLSFFVYLSPSFQSSFPPLSLKICQLICYSFVIAFFFVIVSFFASFFSCLQGAPPFQSLIFTSSFENLS